MVEGKRELKRIEGGISRLREVQECYAGKSARRQLNGSVPRVKNQEQRSER